MSVSRPISANKRTTTTPCTVQQFCSLKIIPDQDSIIPFSITSQSKNHFNKDHLKKNKYQRRQPTYKSLTYFKTITQINQTPKRRTNQAQWDTEQAELREIRNKEMNLANLKSKTRLEAFMKLQRKVIKLEKIRGILLTANEIAKFNGICQKFKRIVVRQQNVIKNGDHLLSRLVQNRVQNKFWMEVEAKAEESAIVVKDIKLITEKCFNVMKSELNPPLHTLFSLQEGKINFFCDLIEGEDCFFKLMHLHRRLRKFISKRKQQKSHRPKIIYCRRFYQSGIPLLHSCLKHHEYHYTHFIENINYRPMQCRIFYKKEKTYFQANFIDRLTFNHQKHTFCQIQYAQELKQNSIKKKTAQQLKLRKKSTFARDQAQQQVDDPSKFRLIKKQILYRNTYRYIVSLICRKWPAEGRLVIEGVQDYSKMIKPLSSFERRYLINARQIANHVDWNPIYKTLEVFQSQHNKGIVYHDMHVQQKTNLHKLEITVKFIQRFVRRCLKRKKNQQKEKEEEKLKLDLFKYIKNELLLD